VNLRQRKWTRSKGERARSATQIYLMRSNAQVGAGHVSYAQARSALVH